MPKLMVLGAGESGRGVALLAQQQGFEVLVSDAGQLSQAAITELDAANIRYESGGHSRSELAVTSVIVKSPGIPWSADFVAFAKTSGVNVQGEMEFCAPYKKGRTIGITGSNGKTTTTLLTYHLLKEAGISVAIGGNVGVSYARLLLEDQTYDWYVLELSSFQLEDIQKFGVDIGMLLNLSPDHLDRYQGSFALYAAAKFRLASTMLPGGTWLQASDELSLKHAVPVPNGVNIERMPSDFKSGVATIPSHTYQLTTSSLAGAHNSANATFALRAAEIAGASSAVLAKAVNTFQNAPHRLELIGCVNGVRYINDSKATNLDATAKALGTFDEPIVWIVGGEDKGNDYTALYTLIKGRIRALVAMGIDNTKIISAFEAKVPVMVSTNNLADAIKQVESYAQRGDVVLLSPACASFDLFCNYIDRGDQFREAVQNLTNFEVCA